MREITIQNNLKVADVVSIGAMKMETMSRRSRFRDYYDLYSVLKAGANLREMVAMAISHSGYMLKEKNLLAILSNGERFRKEGKFKQLAPIYDVTAADIQACITEEIKKMRDKGASTAAVGELDSQTS